ncbi:ZinT/AdcA family metal-binding protein [Gottfriedia acidiceleris]
MLAGCQEEVDKPIDNASSSSESSTNHAHNHSHVHSHDDAKKQEIYSGIFEENEVEDRELSDWEGDWQSVYPYLLDGTLEGLTEKSRNKK